MEDMEELAARLHFQSERERTLFAEAKLGIEVQSFLRTPLGAYMHGCAQQELEDVKQALLDLPPARWSWQSRGRQLKVLELQMRAANARNFTQWLAEAIQQGSLAEHQLEQDALEAST